MTHEETVKIVRVLCASYPNFKTDNIKDVIEAWEMMLSDYSYEAVALSVKTIISTDSSDFAPSIGKVIEQINKLSKKSRNDEITDIEAWDMVLKAIGRGIYYADEEFNKLPEMVQKAIGSPSAIHNMAMDEDLNKSVEKSHFLKIFNRIKEEEEYMSRMPSDVKALLEGGKFNGNDRIGNSEVVSRIEMQMDTDVDSSRP